MNLLLKRIKGMVQTLLLSEVLWATALSIVEIKSSLDIAKDENITIDIIEDEGESIGQHPNCAYIKANTKDGRYIEVIGISIGGGTIKLKGINVNGLDVELNHGLPMLVIDGNMNKAKINHLINDLSDMNRPR